METIKKNGRVLVTDVYVGNLDGTLEDVVRQYEEWSKEYGVPLHDITYHMYDYNEYGYIEYWRDQTEYELQKEREKKAKARERSKKLKEAKEAKERKEYERLHKKYGARAGVSAAE
jgi:hypothetical protein